MKVIFLLDNMPTMEMFEPIASELPKQCDAKFVSYNGSKIEGCVPLISDDKKGVDNLVDSECPDVIVMSREETSTIEHLFATCGVPTLLVPHGALYPYEKVLWSDNGRIFRLSYFRKIMRQGYWGWRHRKVPLSRLIKSGLFRIRHDFRDGRTLSRYDNYSQIATYGEAMKDILLGYGVKEENIVITGNPKYDKYLNVPQSVVKKVLVITDYLVGFGLWSQRQHSDWLKDVCDIVFRRTAKKAEVLIHPVLETRGEYGGLRSRYKLPMNIRQMDIAQCISECDVAITLLSTSGIEMMTAGKPLIVYNPYDNPSLYGKDSGAYIAHNREELLAMLDNLLVNGIDVKHKRLMEEFVCRQVYLLDGKASKRIAKLIVEMTDAKR